MALSIACIDRHPTLLLVHDGAGFLPLIPFFPCILGKFCFTSIPWCWAEIPSSSIVCLGKVEFECSDESMYSCFDIL